MRFLATLEGQNKTERFVAFLAAQDISTHLEPNTRAGEAWDIWVRDEDRLNVARSMLSEYELTPNDAKYDDAVSKATLRLQEAQSKKARTATQIKTRREVFQQNLVGGKVPPITLTLLLIAIVVSILTNFGRVSDPNSLGYGLIKQLSFINQADYRASSGDPAVSLKHWELWRAITPIFIHLSPFHILFNGFMLVSLGRLTERLEGTVKYALIVLVIAIASNLLQGLMPERLMGNPNFGGLSGVTYGLFGYIWVKTSLNPNLGIALAPGLVVVMIGWLVLTFSGIAGGNVANLAHLGGLCSGAAIAYLLTRRES